MEIRALFYGRAGDRVGREATVAVPASATIAELRAVLAAQFPAARDELLSPKLRPCIDDALVPENHALAGSAVVEFFPPLSGG